MTETVTRRVRVVIEGDAHPVSCTSDILRVQYGPHHSVMVHQGQESVTVEDITPLRFWTDGDVVQSKSFTWARSGGLWQRAGSAGTGVSDHFVDCDVSTGRIRVLRYQADEK